MRCALLLAVVAGTACRPGPELPEGISWVATKTDDPLQWSQSGFIALVTPVRPPTSADRTTRIAVLLRVADGAQVPLGGRLPVGSRAVRVEYAGSPDPDQDIGATWQVLDVRGFEWTPQGRTCSVLRRAPGGTLGGLEWRCSEAADARAGDALALLMREGRLRGPDGDAQRAAAGERLARLNDCTACHRPGKVEDRRPGVRVQRATDGEGLFSLLSLWADEDPVERYRPVDPNAADPFLRAVCPAASVDGARCSDGTRPRQHLALAAAVAARDAHALQVCASRRRLAARISGGSAAVDSALAGCPP